FGALILLTAATGVSSLIVFENLRAKQSVLQTRFAERIALLDQIQREVYLSDGLARDFLTAENDADGQRILTQLRTIEEETKRAAQNYSDSAGAANLRAEVMVYWKTLNFMADVGGYRRRSAGLVAYFSRQLAQRREAAAR